MRSFVRPSLLVPLLVVLLSPLLLLGGCTPVLHHRVPATQSAEVPTYGDVVGLRPVTDSEGTYLQTTIDTRKPGYRLLARVLEDSAVDRDGWTSRQVLSAQQWVLRFITEQGADSAVADVPVAVSPPWQEFARKIAPRYVDPRSLDELTLAESALVFRDSAGPLMVEDGHPRLESEVVQLTNITSDGVGSERELAFTGQSTVRYRVTDSGVVAWFVAKGAGSPGEIERVLPQLTDNRAEIQQMSANWTLRVVRHDSSWRISAYQNRWDWVFVGMY